MDGNNLGHGQEVHRSSLARQNGKCSPACHVNLAVGQSLAHCRLRHAIKGTMHGAVMGYHGRPVCLIKTMVASGGDHNPPHASSRGIMKEQPQKVKDKEAKPKPRDVVANAPNTGSSGGAIGFN